MWGISVNSKGEISSQNLCHSGCQHPAPAPVPAPCPRSYGLEAFSVCRGYNQEERRGRRKETTRQDVTAGCWVNIGLGWSWDGQSLAPNIPQVILSHQDTPGQTWLKVKCRGKEKTREELEAPLLLWNCICSAARDWLWVVCEQSMDLKLMVVVVVRWR